MQLPLYVAACLPEALKQLRQELSTPASAGVSELFLIPKILGCFDKYVISLEGRKPFTLSDLLPFPDHAAESMASMQRKTCDFTQLPSVFNNVWLKSGNDDAPYTSAEVHAALAIEIAEGEVVVAFLVQTHTPGRRPEGLPEHAFKPRRPLVEPSNLDGPRQKAALYGCSHSRYPTDAWHPIVNADVVFLSDDVQLVPVDSIVGIADITPVLTMDYASYYPGFSFVGTIISEEYRLVQQLVDRPLLLRRHARPFGQFMSHF